MKKYFIIIVSLICLVGLIGLIGFSSIKKTVLSSLSNPLSPLTANSAVASLPSIEDSVQSAQASPAIEPTPTPPDPLQFKGVRLQGLKMIANVYREPITITNNVASDLTDYPVKLTVTYNTHMRTDFQDIHFRDSNMGTLPYWIESYTTSTSATVWVKVPYVVASGTATIYIYYGNNNPVTTGKAEQTFLLYDDFSDSTLNTIEWTKTESVGGTVTESGTLLQLRPGLGAAAEASVVGLTTFNSPIAFRAKMSIGVGTDVGSVYAYANLGFGDWLVNDAAWQKWDTNGYTYNCLSSSSTQTPYAYELAAFHLYDIVWTSSSEVKYLYDDTAAVTDSTNVPNTDLTLGLYTKNHTPETPATAMSVDIDWLLVRPVVATEPTGAFGAEETVPDW
jgi:hypothetical protein